MLQNHHGNSNIFGKMSCGSESASNELQPESLSSHMNDRGNVQMLSHEKRACQPRHFITKSSGWEERMNPFTSDESEATMRCKQCKCFKFRIILYMLRNIRQR